MARGRMLNRKISTDGKIARLYEAVGDRGLLIYVLLIPHLDRDGRHLGDPTVIKYTVAPRFKDVTVHDVQLALDAADRLGLLRWYEADGDQWLEYPGFRKNQVGLRYEREAESDCPAPPVSRESTEKSSPELVRSSAGVAPYSRRTSAGSTPAEENGMEWNGIEKKEATDRESPRTSQERSEPKQSTANSFSSNFSAFRDIARQLAPPETPDGDEDQIETTGELLDACVSAGINPALSNGSQSRLRELLLERPISALEFAQAIHEAKRHKKLTAGYVVGTIRGARIDACDRQSTTDSKTPSQAPGNGASRAARLPVYEAPTPLTESEQEASARAATAAWQALQENEENNADATHPTT